MTCGRALAAQQGRQLKQILQRVDAQDAVGAEEGVGHRIVAGQCAGMRGRQILAHARTPELVDDHRFAGGIGGTLFSAFQRFDYDFVCAILLCIIGMIMVGEVLAGVVRGIFLERRLGIFGRLDRTGRPDPRQPRTPKIGSEKAND